MLDGAIYLIQSAFIGAHQTRNEQMFYILQFQWRAFDVLGNYFLGMSHVVCCTIVYLFHPVLE